MGTDICRGYCKIPDELHHVSDAGMKVVTRELTRPFGLQKDGFFCLKRRRENNDSI